MKYYHGLICIIMYYNMSSIRESILSQIHTVQFTILLLDTMLLFWDLISISRNPSGYKTEFWKEDLNFLQLYCSDNPSKHLYIHVSI